ncbi:universal stress protein [Natrinema sp. 1APR25-10V2]|uniref:universal stress protein n=1 Tax=Natrinema sp. 1APR25-10V2 TaxID=2951081 RepID=UPI002875545D|nr:universal stress protein [Natrinema sp. 1APR25-10V2]MDS0474004.1 universal stress protein [Natrinema sp. 1APR25-10V2]
MASDVLVPVDESEQSDTALEYALSEHPNAQITALHVVDPADFHGAATMEATAPATYDAIRGQQEDTTDQILSDAEDRAERVNGIVDTEQLVGSPARSIVEFADGHDIDHIVIGTHGRTGTSRVLLGSVAEAVTRRAPVPVTVVR